MKKSDSCFEEAVITMSCILICQRIGVVLTWLVIFVRRYVLLYHNTVFIVLGTNMWLGFVHVFIVVFLYKKTSLPS